jgi:hypothetical protein
VPLPVPASTRPWKPAATAASTSAPSKLAWLVSQATRGQAASGRSQHAAPSGWPCGHGRTELEARLERGKLTAGDLADIGRRLNHGAAEVVVLEERWLALQGEIEKLTAKAAL